MFSWKLLFYSVELNTEHWIALELEWSKNISFYKTLFHNKHPSHLLCVFHFQEPSCDCLHNTCGTSCDRCCPLYNQRPWKSGPTICEQCQCHGHATECQYDPIVAEQRSSLDIYGTYSGGGICINCMVSIKYILTYNTLFMMNRKPLFWIRLNEFFYKKYLPI